MQRLHLYTRWKPSTRSTLLCSMHWQKAGMQLATVSLMWRDLTLNYSPAGRTLATSVHALAHVRRGNILVQCGAANQRSQEFRQHQATWQMRPFFYLAMFGRYKATEFSSIIFNKSASDLRVNRTIHI